jgi:pulcherriminic acid synthase
MPETDILSPAFSEDPYPILETLRDEHPLYYHELIDTYMVSRYEDVERAFKDPIFTTDNYAWQLEPVHGPTILQMEGRDHSKHRNLIGPAFRFRDSALRDKFLSVIAQNSSELIDKFVADGRVDFVDQYTTRYPINVIVDMLGLPKEDHDKFHRWYSSIMAFLSNLTGDEAITAQGLQTKEELQDYVLPIVEERRADPGDDLLSMLCTAEIDGERLTDIEIKAFVSLLLTAGGETTDKSMANMIMRLLEDPDQFEAVLEDRSLIRNAFAETLRHTPPVQMIMRQPSEDVEIGGGVVPAGSTVTALIAAANRDPRQYEDPDRFDIFREDLDVDRAFTAGANHTGFGLGRHFCVGSILALNEVEIGTNQLLDRMKDIAFDGGPPRSEGIFTRAPQTMPLTFTSE